MHEFASGVVSVFLSPFNWIIFLLVAAWLLKKQALRNTCKVLAATLFVVFGNQWLLDVYARSWQPQPVALPPSAGYSCGIIAGGFASPDLNANGYFNSSSDRFIQAVKLYQQGIIKNIIVSGGNGKQEEKGFQEGSWVKGELVSVGIPATDIFVEDRSGNTAENALNTKHILDSLHLPPPYVLITSAFHMPRASLIFKKQGLKIIPFPCNYTTGLGGFSAPDLLPRPSVLLGWDAYLKETLGYFWYKSK